MATEICEWCLDENDQPNENAARAGGAGSQGRHVQQRSGGQCKARVIVDAVLVTVTCTANPKHTREAWDEPFGEIVVGVINQIKFLDQTSPLSTTAEYEEYQRREVASRRAPEEARALGLADFTVHVRPDGPASDG